MLFWDKSRERSPFLHLLDFAPCPHPNLLFLVLVLIRPLFLLIGTGSRCQASLCQISLLCLKTFRTPLDAAILPHTRAALSLPAQSYKVRHPPFCTHMTVSSLEARGQLLQEEHRSRAWGRVLGISCLAVSPLSCTDSQVPRPERTHGEDERLKMDSADRQEDLESPLIEDFLDCDKLISDSETDGDGATNSPPSRSLKRLRIDIDMTSTQYLRPGAHHSERAHIDGLPVCSSGQPTVSYSTSEMEPYSAVCRSCPTLIVAHWLTIIIIVFATGFRRLLV